MTPNAMFKKSIAPYSKPVRDGLHALRDLVLATAQATPGTGKIEEALKWGQHSFLTSETRSGSTIRIGAIRNSDDSYAMYFHCQSGLVGEFREIYGATFTYEGERALIFKHGRSLPLEELRHCVALALTHHLRKKAKNHRQEPHDKSDHHRHRSRPG